MARMYWVIILSLMLIVGWGLVMDDASETTAQETQRKFVGTGSCTMCHNGMIADKDVTTPSSHVWKAGPHAKAYETLASDESKAIAKEKGIEDPQKADECLRCHVTGHGVDAQYLGKNHDVADGVGCESCHGAGEDYADMTVKKAIGEGELEAASVGLLEPNEKICVQCHNEESPTYKVFNFSEKSAKITHPIK